MKLLVRRECKLPLWSNDRIEKLFDVLREHVFFPEDTEISILLTTDNKIARINKIYRNAHYATDVLAFPLLEESRDNFTPEKVMELMRNVSPTSSMPILLGDIVISVTTARQQAIQFGNSFDEEIALLLIHGFLHLMGYDDNTKKNKMNMWKIQKNLLEVTKHVWNTSCYITKGG